MKFSLTKILNIAIVLLLLVDSNIAQSAKKIYGYIYDKDTHIPLVGANVTITGTVIGTVTDESGYFQFDNLLAGSYSVNASFVGYQNKTVNDVIVNVEEPTKIVFYLSPKINELGEITVTSHSDINGSFGTIKLLRKKEIEESNSQFLGELLQNLPGVEIISTGVSQKISIRGSAANQVLILLDGVKLNNQLGGEVDLSQIPTNIIDRIEIYEGGSSAKFGSGAIGGAINIITKSKFGNKFKLNIAYGSYEYWKVEPQISGNYGNIDYSFSYNKIQSSGNYPYVYKNNNMRLLNDIRTNAFFQTDNFFGRINYKTGNNKFSLNVQSFTSERGIPGGIYSLTPYANSKNSNYIFGLNYTGGFKKFNINSNFTLSNSITNYSNLFPANAKPKFKRIPKYNYEYKTKSITGNLDIIYVHGNWYKSTFGYNIKTLNYKDKNFLTSSGSSINNANDFSHGIFLHQELSKNFYRYNFKIVLSPVIRYDIINLTNNKIERNENKWSHGVSLYFSLGTNNKISVKTNYSKSFRMPTFADLFYQDIRISGKANLLPESAINTDITFHAETNFFGKISADVTAFKNSITNMIVWKLGSFEVFKPFNTDAEISGTQFNFEFISPYELFSLGVFYTNLTPLNKNKNITTYNKIIPYKPLTTAKIKIGLKYNNLIFNIYHRSIGKRFVTEANTVEMPSYGVFDATLNFKFNFSKLTLLWKLSATNFTNENYQIIRNYPLPQREWKLGLSISY